jgi:hypothetical protein
MASADSDGGHDSASQADWMRSGLNVDAGAAEDEAPLRRRRFLLSFPGIVTAGAVVTAVSVGVTALTVLGGTGRDDGESMGAATSATSAPATTSGSQSFDDFSGQIDRRNLAVAMAEIPGVDASLAALMRSCADAAAGTCRDLADRLVEQCFVGDGSSCDLLYQVTVVGSPLETYGATCGGRLPPENAGRCSIAELSQTPQSPPS